MKLTITQPFRGRKRLFEPGNYTVPTDLTRIEARCCIADGAGYFQEVGKSTEPFRSAPVKDFAPENKLRTAAPETKSSVEPVRRRGKRTQLDG